MLDLGCGEGELLAWLKEHKNVDGRGVELTGRAGAEGHRARRFGVSGRSRIRAGRLSRPGLRLRHPEPDLAGDARSLAVSARDAARRRAGHRGVPEFRALERAAVHLWSGRAPQTELFPYDWYDSPNIHFLTVLDFEALAEKEHWRVERRIFLSGNRELRMMPNLMAEVAVFLVSGPSNESSGAR